MRDTAKSYASEWATLTGRSESEVYVPVALRPFTPEVGAVVRNSTATGRIAAVRNGHLTVEWSDGGKTVEQPDAFDENGALR